MSIQSNVTLEPAITRSAAYFWTAVGMLGFSLTLTATRAAVPELGGVLVGFGRAVVAAALSAVVLAYRRERWPPPRHWAPLARIAAGVVLGFPALSAWALRTVPASHAQVFVGLSPLATALMAALLLGERPTRRFWMAAAGGALSVLAFGALHLSGGFGAADGLLLLAVALVGLGYAEGAHLAREIGGLRVVSWALIFALPVSLPTALIALEQNTSLGALSPRAMVGFAYVSVVSMFLAFIAWYHGLSLGSIARLSQIQLVMPLLGIFWAALLLGEPLQLKNVAAGLLVGVFAYLGSARGADAQRAPHAISAVIREHSR